MNLSKVYRRVCTWICLPHKVRAFVSWNSFQLRNGSSSPKFSTCKKISIRNIQNFEIFQVLCEFDFFYEFSHDLDHRLTRETLRRRVEFKIYIKFDIIWPLKTRKVFENSLKPRTRKKGSNSVEDLLSDRHHKSKQKRQALFPGQLNHICLLQDAILAFLNKFLNTKVV